MVSVHVCIQIFETSTSGGLCIDKVKKVNAKICKSKKVDT